MSRKLVSLCVLTVLLVSTFSMLLMVQKVEASGTIYIRADGSIDPPTATISTVDNVTYTFTGNIYDSIVVERDNIVIDGAGYNLYGTGAYESKGISLSGRENVTVRNTQIQVSWYGIWLSYASNNSIVGNNITANSGYGIWLGYSSNNTVNGNNITNNANGILIGDSSNMITENNITNNSFDGVVLMASNNIITGNNITKSGRYGIWLWLGSNSNISRNNITANSDAGVRIDSSGNEFHHNNFNNTRQLYDPFSQRVNVWDDGYPSGGNYWSDYNGTDANHDGIGDTPYVIDANNADNYPLMTPYIIPEFQSFLILLLFMILTVLVVSVRRKTLEKKR